MSAELTGHLRGLGVADALSEIGRDRRTGLLEVNGPEGAVVAHFHDGGLVRAEADGRRAEEALAELLVQSEAAAPTAVQDALERHHKSGKPLGETLVEAGATDARDAAGFLMLQTTDTFFRIFEWPAGSYTFRDAAEQVAPLVEALETGSLVTDGARVAEEWPLVQGRVTDDGRCYYRRKPLEGGEHEAGLGPNEMLLYTLVREDRGVRHLEALSRLGRFETRRALFQLLEHGYVAPATITATGEEERRVRKVDRVTRRMQLVHALVNFALIVLIGALAVAVAREHMGGSQHQVLGQLEEPGGGLHALVGDHQEARIRTALEVYWLDRGAYPDRLQQLVEAQLLRESDLTFPLFEEPYFYERRGQRSYELVRPLR